MRQFPKISIHHNDTPKEEMIVSLKFLRIYQTSERKGCEHRILGISCYIYKRVTSRNSFKTNMPIESPCFSTSTPFLLLQTVFGPCSFKSSALGSFGMFDMRPFYGGEVARKSQNLIVGLKHSAIFGMKFCPDFGDTP